MIGQDKGKRFSVKRTLDIDVAKAGTWTPAASHTNIHPATLALGSDRHLMCVQDNTGDDLNSLFYDVAADGTITFDTTEHELFTRGNNLIYGPHYLAHAPSPNATYIHSVSEEAGVKVGLANVYSDTDTWGQFYENHPDGSFDQGQCIVKLGDFKTAVLATENSTGDGIQVYVTGVQTADIDTSVSGAASPTIMPSISGSYQNIDEAYDNGIGGNNTSGVWADEIDEEAFAMITVATSNGGNARFCISHVAVDNTTDGESCTRTASLQEPASMNGYSATRHVTIHKVATGKYLCTVAAENTSDGFMRLWLFPATLSGTTWTVGDLVQIADEDDATYPLPSAIGGHKGYATSFGDEINGLVVWAADLATDKLMCTLAPVNWSAPEIVRTENHEVATSAGIINSVPRRVARFGGNFLMVPWINSAGNDPVTIQPVELTPAITSTTGFDWAHEMEQQFISRGTSTDSDNYSPPAATNGILIVSDIGRNATEDRTKTASMTFDGQAMTKAFETTVYDGSIYISVSVWYLLDPPSDGTAKTVARTRVDTGSMTDRARYTHQFQNVKQEAPVSQGTTYTGGDAGPFSVTTSSVNAKSLMLAWIGGNDTGLNPAQLTSMFRATVINDGSLDAWEFFSYSADGGSVTHTWYDTDGTPVGDYAYGALFLRDVNQ